MQNKEQDGIVMSVLSFLINTIYFFTGEATVG